MVHGTLHSILTNRARTFPKAPVLSGPGQDPLSYAGLLAVAEHVASVLTGQGIGPGDPVALVAPNGPELAAAFLGLAMGAAAAPLNPGYGVREFDFYFEDLAPRALVLPRGYDSPARVVARDRGVSILEIVPAGTGVAGEITLVGAREDSGGDPRFGNPDDVALILHTSGTTSRPKMVPLTQANLSASALNIAGSLELTEEDRCLNVMPLFHIHGLVGVLLSSLSAGASVICTPGFRSQDFFSWYREEVPTWYSAVPTMHQALLAELPAHEDLVASAPLRLVRSSSASLPPTVTRGLEEGFGAPVIEAYGMTEASHQMASNPLPPRKRKVGSVGPAAGPEVAVMNAQGDLLPPGEVGEVVIRGPNVMAGYLNNPEANREAFANGWFRTGDQGRLDGDGYLFLTGRLKEIINRGGEKVSPREVDEALLTHPGVKQVVTFALSHPTLGEDVAVAVIREAGAPVTEAELRDYAFRHLADFKVPSRVVFVDRIPTGPTGKLRRIGLAELLEDELRTPYVAPRSPVEEGLAKIWGEVLGMERVSVEGNFFSLGGDSLRAAQVTSRVRMELGVDLPLPELFRHPTPAGLAAVVVQAQARALDPEALAASLDRLEGLSEEDVRRLLDEG